MSDFKSALPLEVEVPEYLLPLDSVLSRTEPPLDTKSDLRLSDAGGLRLSGSIEDSLDMPGRPRRPEKTLSAGDISSLLFLYAAEPTPRSAVCLNQDGSRAPREAAI